MNFQFFSTVPTKCSVQENPEDGDDACHGVVGEVVADLPVAFAVPSTSAGEFEALPEFLEDDDLYNMFVAGGTGEVLVDFVCD